MNQSPHVLIILDGFGYRHAHEHNAIYAAHPEHILRWQTEYPSTTFQASGTHVGLLPNMIGNSEVGHLTIGSGRIIKQPVSIIHEAIQDGSFFKNPHLIERFKEVARTKKRVHIMGLLSDGGVHSHILHLFALIKMAKMQGVEDIIIHPFLDGRTFLLNQQLSYLTELDKALKTIKEEESERFMVVSTQWTEIIIGNEQNEPIKCLQRLNGPSFRIGNRHSQPPMHKILLMNFLSR